LYALPKLLRSYNMAPLALPGVVSVCREPTMALPVLSFWWYSYVSKEQGIFNHHITRLPISSTELDLLSCKIYAHPTPRQIPHLTSSSLPPYMPYPSTWYCAWCLYGPNSVLLDDYCAACYRLRDSNATYEFRRSIVTQPAYYVIYDNSRSHTRSRRRWCMISSPSLYKAKSWYILLALVDLRTI